MFCLSGFETVSTFLNLFTNSQHIFASVQEPSAQWLDYNTQQQQKNIISLQCK